MSIFVAERSASNASRPIASVVPTDSLPGFAFAYATSSGTVANGSFGSENSTCGTVAISAIGVKSLIGSNGTFLTSNGERTCVPGMRNSV